jgi:hypothetical protein
LPRTLDHQSADLWRGRLTIEARFADGRATNNFATEVFINQGTVAPDATGTLVAHLDVGLVDYQGQTASGVLLRGDNPVLMTFELVLADLG